MRGDRNRELYFGSVGINVIVSISSTRFGYEALVETGNLL